MVIISDIDGCINDLVDKTLSMYNSETGKNIKLDDITAYNFYDCLPKEDADGIIRLFERKELWDSLSLVNDAQWGLKTLIKSGHRVYLTTATHPCNFAYKVDWIKKYFPFINPDNIIRIMDKSLIQADIIVDDCLDHLISSVWHRIVIDHPWNRNDIKDYTYDIHRATNFRDVVNIVNEIERSEEEWK